MTPTGRGPKATDMTMPPSLLAAPSCAAGSPYDRKMAALTMGRGDGGKEGLVLASAPKLTVGWLWLVGWQNVTRAGARRTSAVVYEAFGSLAS